jgi:hypothetical protein
MEASSIAIQYSTITIRGIIDYCDGHRVHADELRLYAAITAAAAAGCLISLVVKGTNVKPSVLASLSNKQQHTATNTH